MKVFRSGEAVFSDITAFLERSLNETIERATTLARSLTPVRTGRARNGWETLGEYRFRRSNRITVIQNTVPYIGILDRRVGIIQPALERAIYTTRRTNR